MTVVTLFIGPVLGMSADKNQTVRARPVRVPRSTADRPTLTGRASAHVTQYKNTEYTHTHTPSTADYRARFQLRFRVYIVQVRTRHSDERYMHARGRQKTMLSARHRKSRRYGGQRPRAVHFPLRRSPFATVFERAYTGHRTMGDVYYTIRVGIPYTSIIQYSAEKLNTNTKAGRRRQTSGVATRAEE